jgi:hypothetical protein
MSSLKFKSTNGFSSLLKEGYKHYGGLEVSGVSYKISFVLLLPLFILTTCFV